MTISNEGSAQGQDKPSEHMKSDAKTAASEFSGQAKQQVRDKLDQNREKISRELDTVAHATQAAAADLSEQNREGLSRYVTELADNMTSLAQNLRSKNVEELMQDASDLARKKPTLFIAGSLALGLGLSRFAKASSKHDSPQRLDGKRTESPTEMYPGFSDEDPESRKESTMAGGYAADSSRSDYTDREFPSTDSLSMTGEQVEPGDNRKADNFGGRSYE